MSNFTVDSFATHLTRTLCRHCAPGEAPRAVADTDAKGRPVLEFTLPNPHDPRYSVSLTASTYKGSVSLCTLWFGQVEITGALDPEQAIPAIEEIVAGNLIAVARYKTRDGYDGRRKASSGGIQWMYQLPDDAEALAAMKEKLRSPAGLWDKLTASMTGVFEVYSWESAEIYER